MSGREGVFPDALVSSKDDAAKVVEMLRAAERPAPPFWQPRIGEEIFIPVHGAQIRGFHLPAPESAARPIVFVPGFGATPSGFQDFYEAVRDRAELYYLETREKSSSRILDARIGMSVDQSARDIQDALSFLGLAARRDFVLVAACWGAAIVLEGLLQGIIDPPTVLVADPMHTLWFPKWLLRFVSPLLPVGAVRSLRPVLARLMLGNMKEPAQRQRAYTFVYSADVEKWKKSAEAARNFELFGRLGGIRREVFILNGTTDKIHDQRDYPRMAGELPQGRFLFMPTDERNRERLFGAAALEFAKVPAGDGLPRSLRCFEKKIRPKSI